MNAISRKRLSTVIPLLIFLVALVPIVLAVIMFLRPAWFALGQNNHGHLVQPAVTIHVPDLQRVFSDSPLPGNFFMSEWTMVYVGGTACDATCRDVLIKTRKIRLLTGRNIKRVQRLYVVRGDHLKGARRLRTVHPDLTVVLAAGKSGSAFAQQFTDTATGPSVYLVDPHGRLMMTYPVEAKLLGLAKDLRHLLKTNAP